MRVLFIIALVYGATSTIAAANECGDGTQTINRLVVPIAETPLRTAPDNQAPKVINPKASGAHKTDYANIDQSTKVVEVCRKGLWSYVRLEEPKWLRATHHGWILTRTLGVILIGKSGRRIYREAEIGWGTDTTPYKKELMSAINGFLQDQCKELDTYSLARSPTRGTKSDPVFFITCGHPPSARNFYFSRADIQKHRGTK